MPAGLGSECRDCYWKRTFLKRLGMNSQGFSNPLYREQFTTYGEWLIEHVTAKEAALLINKHMVFFVEMAEKWACLPTYEQLLNTFGANWLRRAKYPTRWMVERHGLAIDNTLKQHSTERRRIDKILESAAQGLPQEMLYGYHGFLVARYAERDTSLVSVRAALRSAANLLSHTTTETSMPSSKTLRQLLVRTPGIAASVTGFVTYLNETYSLSIKFPNRSEMQKLNRLKHEKNIVALANQARGGEDILEQWIPAALGYFHGVTRLKQSDLVFREEVHGLLVTVSGNEYWIPSPTMELSLS